MRAIVSGGAIVIVRGSPHLQFMTVDLQKANKYHFYDVVITFSQNYFVLSSNVSPLLAHFWDTVGWIIADITIATLLLGLTIAQYRYHWTRLIGIPITMIFMAKLGVARLDSTHSSTSQSEPTCMHAY
jgi:hypothetical protein